MDKVETINKTKTVTKHNFYCDSCGKYLGSSEELDDGYYDKLGESNFNFVVDDEWHKTEGCLCDKCKISYMNMVRKNLNERRKDNMYKFENEENRPDNCLECVEDETCATLFGGYICQKKWRKKEKVEVKDEH